MGKVTLTYRPAVHEELKSLPDFALRLAVNLAIGHESTVETADEGVTIIVADIQQSAIEGIKRALWQFGELTGEDFVEE